MAKLPSFIQDGWVSESIADGWKQSIRCDEFLGEDRSEFQHLAAIQNKSLGRVLVIDDRIQLTSEDEFAYHEMFAHVPIIHHGAAKEVLIIGGGDGATLRETLKHENVHTTLVDIDAKVVEFSRKYLPTLHQGSWDHPRATIVIADGIKFVKETDKRFDVIIIDSTDPEEEGPSSVLYKEDFYADCRRCLTENGIVVTQNGHPQWEKYPKVALGNLARAFKGGVTTVYQFCVPTYMGGVQTFGWASNNSKPLEVTPEELAARWKATSIETLHYTPEYGKASFVLPRWLQIQVEEANAM